MCQAEILFLRDLHEIGKTQVNLRHEGVVAFSLGKCFAILFNRFARADEILHRAGQVHEDPSPRGSARRRFVRLLEQGDRAAAVAYLAEAIGAIDGAPVHVLDIRGRCEPDGQLGELGGGSGTSSCVYVPGRLLHDGGNLAARLRRGEREMPCSFLPVGNEIGEEGMERAAPGRRAR